MKTYSPPPFLFNGHLQTIYPTLFRAVKAPASTHERIVTPDEDFLDLYTSSNGSTRCVIISHGLEGDADRQYMTGMANACLANGFDAIRWNFRGCGSEMNKQLRFYHSGASDDLDVVINHALSKGYTEINLIGFSLGGNMTLKYLGEERVRTPALQRAIVISVPMDLLSSCQQLSRRTNAVYSKRFLKSLAKKIVGKSRTRADMDSSYLKSIRTLIDFDNQYTAPLHGFTDAYDYYKRCSALVFVESIAIDTLIINALNDPFLTPACFPVKQLKDHANVQLETPAQGGHVGFAQFSKNGLYWSEERAIEFLLKS